MRRFNVYTKPARPVGLIVLASAALVAQIAMVRAETATAPQEPPTFASPADEVDFAYRAQWGAYDVVEMHALVEDFYRGRITRADVIRQVAAEQPQVAEAAFSMEGSDPICEMSNLILSQTNGPVGVTDDGLPIFFDVTEFLDGDRQVVPSLAREYNTAVRANAILVDVLFEMAANECPAPPLNNRCCKCPTGTCNCNTIKTAASCEVDIFGNCVHGSTNCLE